MIFYLSRMSKKLFLLDALALVFRAYYALIRNPRILILDDALSSVDTQTEDKILNHLRDVMAGRTTIFISHRVSTVRNADRIAVLHGGRIVELGTHDELIARNGYYSDLYNKQLLEEELAEV